MAHPCLQYIANFSDGLQNSLANPTNAIFKELLGPGGYTSEMKTRISNSLIIGAILGIVVFGYTSDMFSRRDGLLFTSSLVAIGTLMSTLALQVHPSHSMLWYFVIVRGITGFGVGGEYPPSAAAGIEESNDVSYLSHFFLFLPSFLTTAVCEKISRSTFCVLHYADGHSRGTHLDDHLLDLPHCERQ